MALSADLVERYTSEVDVDWHNAFILTHPAAGVLYLTDHAEELEGLVDGFPQLFRPVPTQIVPPARDGSGRQDMSIVWAIIGDEALAYLRTAISVPTSPVVMRWSQYIEGSMDPQIDPWVELSLSQVTASVADGTVTAVASRADPFNRPFPSEVYRVDRFPGLRRR